MVLTPVLGFAFVLIFLRLLCHVFRRDVSFAGPACQATLFVLVRLRLLRAKRGLGSAVTRKIGLLKTCQIMRKVISPYLIDDVKF